MSKKSASDIFKVFAALIFLASAALTFGFFFDHLPSIVPMLDPLTAAIVAGVLGLLIFDGGALAWLKVYLDACDNNDQRTIAITTSVVDISGSAIASFTQIVFAGTSLVTLSPDTQYFVGLAALVAAAGVLTFNFISIWRFHKNSDASKLAIREADRLAKIREEEDEQARHLDDLVVQKVREKLQAAAEQIAETQASRIAKTREMIELAKGDRQVSTPPTQAVAAENKHPQPVMKPREGKESDFFG